MAQPSYAILIPARLGSTRLPEKVLAPIGDRVLVQCVYERAAEAEGVQHVIVCTDSERVADAVRRFGGRVQLTRSDHASGTDRCAEVAEDLQVDAVVNLQGDEPLIEPADLAALARAILEEDADVATLGTPFPSDPAARADLSAVKAIVDKRGWALGFQRAWPDRLPTEAAQVLHHVGVYAFARARLLAFPHLAPTVGEQRERLEQLRALEQGWRFRVLPASGLAFGIDTAEDLARLRSHLGVPVSR